MDDVISLFNIFADIVKTNDFEKLFIIISLLLFVWLFREFKRSKLDSYTLDLQKMNDAIKTYGKAIVSIKKYKEGKLELNLLYDEIYLLYQYATQEVINQINIFISQPDDENIASLSKYIENEIKYIKSLQNDSISCRLTNNYMDSFSYYYKKNNFSLIISPLISAFVVLVCIWIFTIFVLTIESSNIIQKVMIIALTISFVMYTFLIMATFELISKGKFKKIFINKIFFVILILIEVIFLVPNKWFSSISYILYIFIYFIWIFKRTIN